MEKVFMFKYNTKIIKLKKSKLIKKRNNRII